ncbi:MAG: SufD family Fe-S cluster assembly protein [Gammaproteobacteria bacterium]|nr:SufD family Fe-S cluster assembly protein [Gammaproteobacteria bacterium]
MSSEPGSSTVAPTPALESFAALLRKRPTDILSPRREQAMRRLLGLGLPGSRDDSWRYTSLRAIAARRFGEAAVPAGHETTAPRSWLRDCGGEPLVLCNGYLRPVTAAARPGLEIRSLRELAAADPQFLASKLTSASDAEDERWSMLNEALLTDGLYLRIHAPLAEPLLIVHAAEGGPTDAAIHSRLIVDLAPGARATILEHDVGSAGPAVLANRATRIELARGSEIEHYRIVSAEPKGLRFDALELHQGRDSRSRLYTVVLGGGLVRADARVRLDEPGAEHEGAALLVGRDARHVDCVHGVVHAAAHTLSRQTFRAIGAGTSRVVVNSKVLVENGAAGSESRQSCRGLLLSPTAEIDTRPQLEINADEVKCAHGATTGRLDPDMLFYLLSRGIDRSAAQSLLVFAFLDDVLTGMGLANARRAIEDALIAELPDAELLRAFR